MAGIHWPAKFETWVTLHPEFMDQYEAERRALGHPGGYEIVAPPPGEVGRHAAAGKIDRRVSYRWPGMTSSASSGIYAAKVAIEDGFDRVVLAGVPMTAEAGHFTRAKKWTQRDCFMPGFQGSLQFIKDKVRSVSGHTKTILGAPDPDWLNGVTP